MGSRNAARKKLHATKYAQKKEAEKIFEVTRSAAASGDIEELNKNLENLTTKSSKQPEPQTTSPQDAAKQLKKLKKLLRQIEELEDRVESGDTRPDTDQIAKMNRKTEVLD